jgi:uncharacterized protein (DUF1501 family)
MKRRDFLLATGAAGLAALSARPGRRAFATDQPMRPPRRLLVVFASGGWDTACALDPKAPPLVSVPDGAVQRFGELDVFTHASRPSVTQYFERHADHTAILRGIVTDGIFHNECQRRIATGSRDEGHPDIGAMIAHDLGNALPIPYLMLGELAYAGPYNASAARVGTTNQIVTLLDDPAADPATGPPVLLSATEDDLLRRYAAASADRARASRGATGYNRRRIDDFADAAVRGQRLQQLRGRFGARGETQAFASQLALALDALQQDLSQAVMTDTRLAWDSHVDNDAAQAACHEALFGQLTQLVDQLVARPGRAAGTRMIDDTVVVVFSELSRTPLVNGTVPPGKEHWPITSAIVLGAGVRGGHAYGATTAGMSSVPIDLTTGRPAPTGVQPMYSHFIAGLLALCGADPTAHFATTPAFDAFVA